LGIHDLIGPFGHPIEYINVIDLGTTLTTPPPPPEHPHLPRCRMVHLI